MQSSQLNSCNLIFVSKPGRPGNLLYSYQSLHAVGLLADKLKSAGNSMRKTGNSFKESNVEKGMVLPFTPLTMTFNNVHYFVDCPPVGPCCPLLVGLPLKCFHQVLLKCTAAVPVFACMQASWLR